ncbi:MAG: ligand-binding sensor domain-containing protein, partial [Phenylobacterium sp.]
FASDTVANSLTDDMVQLLYVDNQGTLWVATQKGGLNRYNAKQQNFTAFKHDPQNANSLSDNYILALLDNGDGTLWVGTTKGLDLFDTTTGQVRKRFKHNPQDSNSLPNAVVNVLLKTSSGQLWVGTMKGLARYDKTTNQFQTLAVPSVPKPLPLVSALLEDDNGHIWIATYQGVFEYNPDTGEFIDYQSQLKSPYWISGMVRTSDGAIWLASLTHGLYQISPSHQGTKQRSITNYRYDKSNPFTLADNALTSLYVDNAGVLWTGTYNAGVSRLAYNTLDFGFFDDSFNSVSCLPSQAIFSLLEEDGDTLWIGSQAGLVKANIQTGTCQQFNPPQVAGEPAPEVKSIYRDRQQQLWVGTGRGLLRYDPVKDALVKVSGQLSSRAITFITEDNKGRLVVASFGQLYLEKDESFEEVAEADQSPGRSYIHVFATDATGRLWLGTHRGLAWLDTDSDTMVYPWLNDQPRFAQPVRALHFDKRIENNHQLWMGSQSVELFKFNIKTEQVQPISVAADLPATTEIGAILADEVGHLWISSSAGLLRFHPDTGATHVFKRSDGLQSNVFFERSAFRSADGHLIFGGRKGFNRFYPQDIKINAKPPKVALTGFSYFNQLLQPGKEYQGFTLSQPASLTKTLTLSHRDYVFGFDFAALDFADPSRNQYAYKMDGFDQNWNSTNADNRRASYTNLDAGSYTFKVKAANKDGVWSDGGVAVALTIKAAPWATGWAYTAYVLILLGGLLLTIKVRTAVLTARAKELQQSVAQRTAELAKRNNGLKCCCRKNMMNLPICRMSSEPR